jgi:hypothetical protein
VRRSVFVLDIYMSIICKPLIIPVHIYLKYYGVSFTDDNRYGYMVISFSLRTPNGLLYSLESVLSISALKLKKQLVGYICDNDQSADIYLTSKTFIYGKKE